MGARSKFLKRNQERLARARKTEKFAFSKANSGEFPVKQKFDFSPTVGVSDVADNTSAEKSSKNVFSTCEVSQVLPSQQTTTNVSPQKITVPETSVLVELVESLKGVITKFENAVKSSPSCQNICLSCQSDAGSSDFKNKTEVSSPKSEISFCERSKDEKSQIVKNVVSAENEFPFEKSKNFVHVLDESDNAVELIKSYESFTPIDASETNSKQEDGETGLVSWVSSNPDENKATIEAARDTTKSCDEKCPLSYSDSNAVLDVTKNAIDGICFPFSPDSSIISVSIEGHDFSSLVDTGAAVTAVNANVWNKYLKNSCSNLSSSNSEVVTTANGFPLKILGKTLVKFVIHSEVFPCEAHVIEGLTYDIILGRDFLQTFSSKIDFDQAKIEFSQQENPLPFHDMKDHGDDYSAMDTSFVCSVHADFSFIVPPESEVVVPGRLISLCGRQRPNTTGVVTPRPT